LTKFPESAFLAANFTSDFYTQLKTVAHDEEAHVVFLTAALTAAGVAPVAACTYSFPMDDPLMFVTMASVVEGVGVSAYLGAAAGITSKTYLTAAGAILVTEALHQSAERDAIGEIPMANILGTPMGMNAVYSIASQFIVSCPSSNAPLPVKAYPALTELTGLPVAVGVSLTFATKITLPSTYFFTFVSGLDILPVPSNGLSAVIPPMVSGQSYVFITSDNSGNLTDSTILAGPAIIEVTTGAPTYDVTLL
jgi:hypothetical protein